MTQKKNLYQDLPTEESRVKGLGAIIPVIFL